MEKKNIFQIIGNGIVTGFCNVIFFCWGVFRRIMYFPKVVYENDSVKKKLKKPCICIANHTSHADGSFVPQMFPGKKLHVLVMSKWFDKKALNVFFSHLNYIRIDLNDMDTQWLDDCKKVIEAGKSVLIFPEGKLETTGGVEEFMPGFLMLARQTGAPVIPMAITGGYKKFHRQTIKVADEIDFDVHQKGRPSAILKEGAVRYADKIKEMLGQE